MFPSIKNKVFTQGRSRTKIKKSSSIFISSKKKESCIKACTPYIEELKLSSIKCSPQKYSLIQNRKRMHTEVNSRNMDSSQNIKFIPEQINYDQNTFPASSQMQVKSKLSKNRAQLRLQILLKQFEKMKHDNDEENKTLLLQKSRSSKKYDSCINQFQKLPKNKLIWTEQVIQPFYNQLIKINTFFKKLKPLVSLCLLKIGHIKVFQKDQLIQKENDQMTMIGIILWGEALLKNCQNKLKIYLFSGDSINQQLIFPGGKEMLGECFSSKRGYHSAKQSGKTKTQTGILYLKLSEYKMIFQQLVKIGQKNSILLAENMMKWSFAKKKNTRKQFSHI